MIPQELSQAKVSVFEVESQSTIDRESEHSAQESMPKELQTMLGRLTENTGMVLTIFLGGPEPKQGGDITTLQ